MSEVPLYWPFSSDEKGTRLSSGVCGLYRGTSLIKKQPSQGHYSSPVPWALWWSLGGGCFL